VRDLLTLDPKKRLTAKQVLQHPWVTRTEWSEGSKPTDAPGTKMKKNTEDGAVAATRNESALKVLQMREAAGESVQVDV